MIFYEIINVDGVVKTLKSGWLSKKLQIRGAQIFSNTFTHNRLKKKPEMGKERQHYEIENFLQKNAHKPVTG